MPQSKSESIRSTKIAERTPWTITELSDAQVRSLAERIFKGEVFTNCHLRPGDDMLLGNVFMPLMFMGDKYDADDMRENPPGLIYADLKDAGPRAINGYPIFWSCSFASREDAQRVWTSYRKIVEAVEGR